MVASAPPATWKEGDSGYPWGWPEPCSEAGPHLARLPRPAPRHFCRRTSPDAGPGTCSVGFSRNNCALNTALALAGDETYTDCHQD